MGTANGSDGPARGEAPKQLVRRFVAEVRNQGRLEAIDELVVPELVASFRQQAMALRQAFGAYRVEIEELVAEGDTVVLRACQHGLHRGTYLDVPATGRAVTWHVVRFFRFNDGRIAESWALADERALLRQLIG